VTTLTEYELESPERYAELAEKHLNEGTSRQALVYATLAQTAAMVRLTHATEHGR
jgi:hypothetical protein